MKNVIVWCLLLIVLIFCTGCDDVAVVDKRNKQILGSPGELVGKLPDGREVRLYELDLPDTTRSHYIYVVGSTATLNTPEQVGKDSHDKVIVTTVAEIKELLRDWPPDLKDDAR